MTTGLTVRDIDVINVEKINKNVYKRVFHLKNNKMFINVGNY